jgi:membrane protease subunit (stomatin/prohibitin family)
VGTLPDFTAEKLSEYFRGVFITRIKTEIANSILTLGTSILEISTKLDVISNTLKISLNKELEEYGVRLKQFNIHSINVPESDPAVISLKTALAKKAEMGIVGFNYQQERSFDVMQTAAGNEGTAGNVMGAGMGLGMGLGIGTPLAANFSQVGSNMTQETAASSEKRGGVYTHDEKMKMLRDLAEMKTSGILTEEEFQLEKKKILDQ